MGRQPKHSRSKICNICSSKYEDVSQGNQVKTCSEYCQTVYSRFWRSSRNKMKGIEVAKIAMQNRSCQICNKTFDKFKDLVIDHCHDTNTFRGILCRHCNTGIGLLKNSKNMERAASYVLSLETDSPKHEISRIMTLAYNRGWISSRDGNASILKDNKFYITPSGVLKFDIDPKTILDGSWESYMREPEMDSNVKPSGEYLMHIEMYSDKNVNAVLHLHPTYTIAALHRGFNLQDFEKDFAEINRFMKVGYNVPAVPPISKELAVATKSALLGDEIRYDIVGQVAHGVCAIGKTLQECYEHIERLEHICQIVLASGVSPK